MIGVSSLDLLAFPVRFTPAAASWPSIDARRGEVFYAFYRQVPGGVQRLTEPPGRLARRPRRPSSWPPARSAAGRRRRAPLRRRLRRPRRRRAGRAGARPPVGPVRSCSSPTPRPCARSGCSRGSSSRSTCASPTPRSTGRRGRAVMAAQLRVARPACRPRGGDRARCARRHLRGVLRIEHAGYPRPWSLGLFMSELAHADHPRATSWPSGRHRPSSATPA